MFKLVVILVVCMAGCVPLNPQNTSSESSSEFEPTPAYTKLLIKGHHFLRLHFSTNGCGHIIKYYSDPVIHDPDCWASHNALLSCIFIAYVAKAEKGKGWRIWERKMGRWWGNYFPIYPEALIEELNNKRRPEKIVELTQKYGRRRGSNRVSRG